MPTANPLLGDLGGVEDMPKVTRQELRDLGIYDPLTERVGVPKLGYER